MQIEPIWFPITYNALLFTVFHEETGDFSLHHAVTTHSTVPDCTVSVTTLTCSHIVKLVGVVEHQKLGGRQHPAPPFLRPWDMLGDTFL